MQNNEKKILKQIQLRAFVKWWLWEVWDKKNKVGDGIFPSKFLSMHASLEFSLCFMQSSNNNHNKLSQTNRSKVYFMKRWYTQQIFH